MGSGCYCSKIYRKLTHSLSSLTSQEIIFLNWFELGFCLLQPKRLSLIYPIVLFSLVTFHLPLQRMRSVILLFIVVSSGPRRVSYHCCSSSLVTKWCLILLRLHGLQPARLLCPWDSPGKNPGVFCHFLL